MALAPRGTDVKRFRQKGPAGPVVTLDPLRFAEGGRESHDR